MFCMKNEQNNFFAVLKVVDANILYCSNMKDA